MFGVLDTFENGRGSGATFFGLNGFKAYPDIAVPPVVFNPEKLEFRHEAAMIRYGVDCLETVVNSLEAKNLWLVSAAVQREP